MKAANGITEERSEVVGQVYEGVLEAVVGTKGAGVAVKGITSGAKMALGAERLAVITEAIANLQKAMKLEKLAAAVKGIFRVGRREESITERLNKLAAAAKSEAKLSVKQEASIQRSLDRAAKATDPKSKAYHEMMAAKKERMYRGTQIDTKFKAKVDADEFLKEKGIKTTPRGKTGPDVYDKEN